MGLLAHAAARLARRRALGATRVAFRRSQRGQRREEALASHLRWQAHRRIHSGHTWANKQSDVSKGSFRIIKVKDVAVSVRPVESVENVPTAYSFLGQTSCAPANMASRYGEQAALDKLRWMLQKEKLGQDVFLVGTPGPSRRRLAMWCCEVLQREVEYLALSRDTTESDLKQRREIRKGNVEFVDSAPVRAALNGRVLILDGIERAERNVLPTLNNLLEGREMSLPDGRFLVAHSRYDDLIAAGQTHEQLTAKGLVRVHPDFRVIALGLPVPAFAGFPLDPPLRSRFQGLFVGPPTSQVQRELLRDALQSRTMGSSLFSAQSAHGVDHQDAVANFITNFSKFSTGVRAMSKQGSAASGAEVANTHNKLPFLTEVAVEKVISLLAAFPDVKQAVLQSSTAAAAKDHHDNGGGDLLLRIFRRYYPDHLVPGSDPDDRLIVPKLLESAGLATKARAPPIDGGSDGTIDAAKLANDPPKTLASWDWKNFTARDDNGSFIQSEMQRAFDLHSRTMPQSHFYVTPQHSELLASMGQDVLMNNAVCLVGHRGTGKSAVVAEVARAFGYLNSGATHDTASSVGVEVVQVFKDMTSRDLLQRRVTSESGDTFWETSPLVEAALRGSIAVLDGIHRLEPGALATLNELCHDRNLTLHDGTQLLRHDRFDAVAQKLGWSPNDPETVQKMATQKNLRRIDPSFRLFALAAPPTTKNSWLSAEVLEMFAFHEMPQLSPRQLIDVAQHSIALEGVAAGTSHRLDPDLEHRITNLLEALEKHHGSGAGADSVTDSSHIELNVRQVKRILRQHQSDSGSHNNLNATVRRAILGDFFPPPLRDALNDILDAAGMHAAETRSVANDQTSGVSVLSLEAGRHIQIGEEIAPISTPAHPELVPKTKFFDIPSHIKIMETMLRDWHRGERYSLLIGNQGTGKNKITDRLLQLLKLEREYMQLHRDTTIPHLTTTPTLVDGVRKNVL